MKQPKLTMKLIPLSDEDPKSALLMMPKTSGDYLGAALVKVGFQAGDLVQLTLLARRAKPKGGLQVKTNKRKS